MSQPLYSDHDAAQAVLSMLDYLSDLFTGCEKETFSRVDILAVLNMVRSDSDLLDPDMVIAYQVATAELEEEAAN